MESQCGPAALDPSICLQEERSVTLYKAGSDWMFLAEHADEFDPTLPVCLRSLTFHPMLVLQRRYLSIPPSARLFPIALTAQ
ncbi:hypothetical protein NQZ68_019992 [Dissostichus eleginoides]|nr:hypothetical protein NQZ68_019992 [Dissostichus eleginoides]